MSNFIPVEIRDNKEEIIKIASRAMTILDEENNVVIPTVEVIPTIAYVFMKSMIQYLNENKEKGVDTSINFMQLMDIGITYRNNDDAEKDGNFTPLVVAGQEFKLLIKDDDKTE